MARVHHATFAVYVALMFVAVSAEVIKNAAENDLILYESLSPTNKSLASRRLLLLGDTGNICYTGSSCQSSTYACASGYSCYLVTDGSCSPSSCNSCSSGSTYYGCYTSQPGTTTVNYELDSSSGLRCYQSSSDCNSVASNTCTGGGTSCTYGGSSYCSTTGASYNYYCPNSVTTSAPSNGSPSSGTCVPGNSWSSSCNGCSSCNAAQSCSMSACSAGAVTNFACSSVNGVGSWSATCTAASATSASAALRSAAFAMFSVLVVTAMTLA